MGAIYGFKLMVVEKELSRIRSELKNMTNPDNSEEFMGLLNEQIRYDKAKRIIYQELGRI
jgi:hypothetical protein